ncbi:hypothetical protein KEJ49_07190 [Candidatus Bathyarchaeota archaeon]|nr:hypothetical protein [Candidatus Bathyarchaeota archaeon]
MDEGEPTSKPVKIATSLKEAIRRFLESEEARRLGYRYEIDVVNQSVREFLIKHGFLELEENRFEHFNVYEDHVTIWDKKLRRLVDVYFSGRKPYIFCSLCEDSECDHIQFALSIPEALKALKEKGWRIEEGKVLYVPP